MSAYFRVYSFITSDYKNVLTFNAINGTLQLFVFKRSQNNNEKSQFNLKLFMPDIMRLKLIDYLESIKIAEPKTYINMTIVQPNGDQSNKDKNPDDIPNKKVKVTVGKDSKGIIFFGLTYLGLDKRQYKDKYDIISKVNITFDNDPNIQTLDDQTRSLIATDIFIDFLKNRVPVILANSLIEAPPQESDNTTTATTNTQSTTSTPPPDDNIDELPF